VALGLVGLLYVSYGPLTQSIKGHGGFRFCNAAIRTHCVIDGDTIRYNGQVIRIKDIDAPETRNAKCASEKALGERAKRRLLELLNAGPIEVVYDGGRSEDRYGRKLRVIEYDGRSVGHILTNEGLAQRWTGHRWKWCD